VASVLRGNIIACDGQTSQSTPPYDYGDSAPYDYSRDSAIAALRKPGIKLRGILLTNTSANAELELQDGGNGDIGLAAVTLLDLKHDTDNDSKYFAFEPPVFFPNGIIVSTITNCSAYLFIEQIKGQ